MNGGIVPLLLLSAALGFALSFTTERSAWIAAAVFATAAVAMSFVPVPGSASGVLLAGLLVSTLVTAGLVYLPQGIPSQLAVVTAANDGIWLGLVAASAFGQREMIIVAPTVFLFIPGQWIATRGFSLAIKVACSWLIAIAALAIFVSLVPTPGYKPDHME